MGRLTVFFLSLFLSFCILSEPYAAERVTQETKGDQSPAIYVSPGGTSNINYRIDAQIDQILSEVRKEFSKCLEVTTAFQSKKLEELNKTLAELLVQNLGVPEEDAKKWARDIVEKAPGFKKEIENNNALIKKYNEELSKDLMAKVYKAFAYVFETVDSRLLALKELSPKTTYARDDRFVLFSDETSQIKSYTARSFVFANGARVAVTLTPGKLKQSLIQTCPSLDFIEFAGQSLTQSFKVTPHYGGGTIFVHGGVELKKERTVRDIKYSATGADVLTDGFKKELNKAFSEFIKLASTR